MYPNQVVNVLNVDVPAVKEAGNIEVLNLTGVQLYRMVVNAARTYKVCMQQMPAGMYQVKVISEVGVIPFRVQNLR